MRLDNLKRRVSSRVQAFVDRIFLSPDKRRQRAFQHVYSGQQWGTDGDSEFYSGHGSRGESVSVYVSQMSEVLQGIAEELGRDLNIVDIGCGDFEVGRALIKASPIASYVGCDIVPNLVERNNREFSSDTVSFRCVDIVTEDAPRADVCLVRQVLQHLSNEDIIRAISRLDYPYVFVTEGHPLNPTGKPNPNKSAGASVRFNWKKGFGRGVELSLPPYNLKTKELFRVNESGNVATVLVTERVITQ